MRRVVKFLIFIFAMHQQKAMAEDYKIVTVNEAMCILNANGMSGRDHKNFSQENPLGIKSQKALIYVLPTHEILMTPVSKSQNFQDYPCFLFTNIEAFKTMRDANHFPIPVKNMTLWKREYEHIEKMDWKRYDVIAEESLRIKLPQNPEKLNDLDILFDKLFAYLKKKDVLEENKMLVRFASVIVYFQFFVKTKGAKIILKEKYEIYNPILVPTLYFGNMQILVENILYDCLTASDKTKARENFHRRATGEFVNIPR